MGSLETAHSPIPNWKIIMSKNLVSSLKFLFVLLGVGAVIASGGGSSSSTPPPGVTPTPNANFVVFLADGSFVGTEELYMYSLASGATTKVNLDLLNGRQVSSFAISPDRQWVAYIATQDVSGTAHLYVRDAELASAPVRLSPVPGRPGGNGASSNTLDAPVWAPDSSRIAYRNDARLANTFELSTVAPTGGTPVDVSDITIESRSVSAGSYTWHRIVQEWPTLRIRARLQSLNCIQTQAMQQARRD
jgi:hypothetical protein